LTDSFAADGFAQNFVAVVGFVQNFFICDPMQKKMKRVL
jgi:hypothetical protein